MILEAKRVPEFHYSQRRHSTGCWSKAQKLKLTHIEHHGIVIL
jgi:hypothetical protein